MDQNTATPATITKPPKIGTPWAGGGIYAGLIRGQGDERDYHLVVHDGEDQEAVTWQAAVEWAHGLGAGDNNEWSLPRRAEQAVMYGNVPELFADDWYWSGEQYAGDESYAWYQNFYHGAQYGHLKSNELRARAVRRIAI